MAFPAEVLGTKGSILCWACVERSRFGTAPSSRGERGESIAKLLLLRRLKRVECLGVDSCGAGFKVLTFLESTVGDFTLLLDVL